MFDDTYISLGSLVTRLGLPKKYIKELVEDGDIPFLDVNGRPRFSEPEVREALAILAHKRNQDQKRNPGSIHEKLQEK